ncbi:hypothetical protein [Streptomyces sp. NPDC059460]|uniref:hypothetical protein n=1 Tax=Streptomyces sp. NPDC059460 TaxID=3346840 RepID=UPI00367B4A1B
MKSGVTTLATLLSVVGGTAALGTWAGLGNASVQNSSTPQRASSAVRRPTRSAPPASSPLRPDLGRRWRPPPPEPPPRTPEQAAAIDRAIHGLEDISVVVGVLILGPHRDPELAEAVSMATHALRSGAESAPAGAPQAADTEADLLLAALTADALQLRRAGAALT